LMRDFKRLQQDPPAGISGAPQDNNIMLWNAVIFGYPFLSSFLLSFSFLDFLLICFFFLFVDLMILHGMEVGNSDSSLFFSISNLFYITPFLFCFVSCYWDDGLWLYIDWLHLLFLLLDIFKSCNFKSLDHD
jgi:hypothetical protein